MDNKIEMYKEMVLKGEKLEKEQAMDLLTVDWDTIASAAALAVEPFSATNTKYCICVRSIGAPPLKKCGYKYPITIPRQSQNPQSTSIFKTIVAIRSILGV